MEHSSFSGELDISSPAGNSVQHAAARGSSGGSRGCSAQQLRWAGRLRMGRSPSLEAAAHGEGGGRRRKKVRVEEI